MAENENQDQDQNQSQNQGPDELEKVKGTLKEVIADRNSLKAKLKEATGVLEELKAREESRKAEEDKLKSKAEREKMENEGRYKEALEKTTNEYETRLKSLKSSVASKIVPNAIKSAAAKVENIDPSALDDLPLLLNGKVRLDDETMDVFVADEDGKPLKDDKLKQVSLEDYVKDFVQKRPRMIIDKQVTGVGIGIGAGIGKDSPDLNKIMSNPKLMAEWEKADPEGYKKAVSTEFFSDPKAMARKTLGI